MQRGRNLEEKNTEGKKPRNNGEVMATFVKNGRQNGKGKEGSKNLTLEEKKKMKYSFHDDDVEGIFNELMKEKAIQLPEPKRPSEVDKINDPKYCCYHRIINHPLSKCYILKNIIRKMINDGEIEVIVPLKYQLLHQIAFLFLRRNRSPLCLAH